MLFLVLRSHAADVYVRQRGSYWFGFWLQTDNWYFPSGKIHFLCSREDFSHYKLFISATGHGSLILVILILHLSVICLQKY